MNKKLIYSCGMLLAGLLLTACSNGDWEDNLKDTIDQGGNNGKISVYFAMQDPVQPIILGNDDESDNTDHNNHQFKLMATWGGGYNNTKDCKIRYEIKPSLLEAGSGMEVLPTTHYTLEDPSVLTIPAGSVIGGTTVHLTDAFFNDPKAATNHYVLPVSLEESLTGDSIIEDKSYQLLCVKYINQYAGLYCKTGTSVVKDFRTITHKNEDTPLDEVISVDIPRGLESGMIVPVKEKGNCIPGGLPGNLLFVIEELPDKKFTRKGDDLVVECSATIPQAILGGTIDITTIDDKIITLEIPPGSQPGKNWKLKGKGINGGSLIIILNIFIPSASSLSNEELKFIESLKNSKNFNNSL